MAAAAGKFHHEELYRGADAVVHSGVPRTDPLLLALDFGTQSVRAVLTFAALFAMASRGGSSTTGLLFLGGRRLILGFSVLPHHRSLL